ncbi:hypothetical protein A3A46_03605 [Candidatus Roizmanbacteria bacterium RIFCSPLOWO2_01_FULL_37_13]|uniref:DUF5655 domain-containing protein n=1 Tax=Candidatus Roizmanbacteria bacterium RIFCSPHIGHO2_02_FULL_38_11 TaxID=1802039 RepID=A0A1F7GZJ2_9BACT|nr:MAG: hypothetical protein A3C25_04865 [Candidatus Roizmanbacteria bacterium RIFCSPHIGHO2_02_FULL_38_11]OGK42718.1 MAG: hypothetical protein A3A46_03605 [Candidatus Roizmanbacteria bacterium RIFCSPLOWO2_01_FULL_37_13]
MPIFRIATNKLVEIEEKAFDLEKTLHKLTEESLDEVFGYEFVSGVLNKQLIVQGFELDTLAFDPEAKAFVIIEYKKDKSFSVIDQGYNYLGLMLNNKAEFILEYNERRRANLKRDDVDWSQSKVVFVAPSFTSYQKGAIAFKGLPIELWEVALFKDNLVLYNQIKPPEVSESIEKVTKNKVIESISKQVKTYTVEDHLDNASDPIKELFKNLQREIFEVDSRVQEKPVSWYIGYKIRYFNFCSVRVYKDKLVVYTRKEKIDDPKKIFKKVPSKWKWGKTAIWHTDITKESEIDYVMSVVRQGYEAAPDK